MEELLLVGLLFLLGGGSSAGEDSDKPDGGPDGLPKPPNGLPPKPTGDVGGGKVNLGDVKPLPKPEGPAKPAKPAVIGKLPGQGKIKLSNDCKTGSLEPGWEDAIAPMVNAAVAQGAGMPVYLPQQASKSVDAVIRTVVNAQAGSQCINAAPWLDRWEQQHPIPKPTQGKTTSEYLMALGQWDDTWEQHFGAWAASHQQAYNVFRAIGNYIVSRWAGEVGVTPRGPGAPGPMAAVTSVPKSSRPADINQLRSLGYDIYPQATEEFQEDFNMVMDARTNFGWTQFGYALDVDNKFGPKTRQAMQEAMRMAGGSPQGWSLVLQTAREALSS